MLCELSIRREPGDRIPHLTLPNEEMGASLLPNSVGINHAILTICHIKLAFLRWKGKAKGDRS